MKVSVITVISEILLQQQQVLLLRCIESVQNQTYTHIEHLIVGLTSKNGNLEFLKGISGKKRIAFIPERSGSYYKCLNEGLLKAAGKYVAFLNFNDFYHDPDSLAISVKKLVKTDADFSYGCVRLPENLTGELIYQETNAERFFCDLPFHLQSMLAKREILLAEGMFDAQFGIDADYDLMLRLYLRQYKNTRIQNALVTCGNNMNDVDYWKAKLQRSKVFQKNYNFLNRLSEIEAIHMSVYKMMPEELKYALMNYFGKSLEEACKPEPEMTRALYKLFGLLTIWKKDKACREIKHYCLGLPVWLQKQN